MPPHAIERRLEDEWPAAEWSDVTVLVAVSGGADSVALMRALAAIRQAGPGRLVVAHFNHRLRGAESDGDEAFVRTLAEGLGLLCDVGRAERAIPPLSLGEATSEEQTRALRYAFLEEAVGRWGARFVVTAHTADDQAETILHRILRGTGLAGLAGMRRARQLNDGVALLRPLLNFRRDELRGYLADLGQPFRQDASNLDSRYTRNRLRNELLPHLASEYNPRVSEALLRLGELARDTQAALLPRVEQLLERSLLPSSDGRVHLDCQALLAEGGQMPRQALMLLWRNLGWAEQSMTRQHWDRLAALVQPCSPHQKIMLPGNIVAERTCVSLVMYRLG
ncbi:MAG: tRNA lysidine(34) synthetase TilS [Pirellulales bacterium]